MTLALRKFAELVAALGRTACDHLLIQVAARLNDVAGESSGVAARLADTTLALHLPDLDPAAALARVRRALDEPLRAGRAVVRGRQWRRRALVRVRHAQEARVPARLLRRPVVRGRGGREVAVLALEALARLVEVVDVRRRLRVRRAAVRRPNRSRARAL